MIHNHYLFSVGETPFICGGYGETYGDFYDDCYKYIAASDEWVNSGYMSEKRVYSGYGSSEKWGLVMAGGWSQTPFYEDALSSVETSYNGETFTSLPDMPGLNGDSCLVVIDDDRIFTCGGHPNTRENITGTLIFTESTNTWNKYDYTSYFLHGQVGLENFIDLTGLQKYLIISNMQ